jgi:hypothetical protein
MGHLGYIKLVIIVYSGFKEHFLKTSTAKRKTIFSGEDSYICCKPKNSRIHYTHAVILPGIKGRRNDLC